MPVFRIAKASSNVLPGRMSTVATSVPSENAATLLAASFGGSSTHPIQVADGIPTAPPDPTLSSNTSTDSRPPWLVAYTV